MPVKNLTALVSAFSRAYHAENNEVKIFDDTVARSLLTDEEYSQISNSMSGGIDFFNPSFVGAPDAALKWIVDNQLSPTPLARAAFAENRLETAVSTGAKQYLMLGAGYDTFAYRQPPWANRLRIFEIDQSDILKDKRIRLDAAKTTVPDNVHYIGVDFTKDQWQTELIRDSVFETNLISFCSLLGVIYYLPQEAFVTLIYTLSLILPKRSSIVFDYPDEDSYTEKAGERAKKQAQLASAANEKMLASYSCEDMAGILSANGFIIREHLTPVDITQQYFSNYNRVNASHRMTAFDNVNYCLAVRE